MDSLVVALKSRVENLEKENYDLKIEVIELSMNDPVVFKVNMENLGLRKSNKLLTEENLNLIARVQDLDRRRYQAEKELQKALDEVQKLFGEYNFTNGVLVKTDE